MKNLMLPIQDLETLYNQANELIIRHFPGDAAIQLRFDGNAGRFKYGNDDFLTNVGEEFCFNPIAFRAFIGRPFEQYQTPEMWIELFGVTQAKCTFRILLRGASSTELNKFAYFLNVRPTETYLKLKPVMRHNKAFGKNYYILTPEFEPVKKKDKEILEDIKAMLYIYSNQFIGVDRDNKAYTTIIAENYCNDDFINENAFRYFQVTAEMPTLKAITEQKDPELLELPSNPKGVKKAA